MTESANLEVVAQGEREIVITRLFSAPRNLVFEAHAKPELLRRWLLGPQGWSMPVCEIDFRVGGRYHYIWRHGDGREMGISGVHREIVAPERIVSTEAFDGANSGEAINTLVLTERGGKTTLTLTALYPSREIRERALRSGMNEGLAVTYQRLDEMLVEQAR